MLKIVTQVVNILILAIILFIGWQFYNQLNEEAPIKFHPPGNLQEPFVVDKHQYKIGDTINFTFERCADYPLEYTFTQSLHNLNEDVVYHFESITVIVLEQGCTKVEAIPKVIEADRGIVPGDRYRMEFGLSVRGKYRDFIVPMLTNEFEILPAEDMPDEGSEKKISPSPTARPIPRGPFVQSPAPARVTPTPTPRPTPTPSSSPAENGSTPSPEPSKDSNPTPTPAPTPSPTPECTINLLGVKICL